MTEHLKLIKDPLSWSMKPWFQNNEIKPRQPRTCVLIYCNSLNVEPTDTVSFPNQPPKQADGVDDVVVPMDTVSSPNQPPKQADGVDDVVVPMDTVSSPNQSHKQAQSN